MKPRLLVGSALGLMLIAGAAMAQSDGMGGPMSPAPFSASTPGWYGAVDIGGHFPDDFRLIPEDQATQALTLKDYQNVDVFARVGYRFNPYFRLELQGGYRPGVLKGASSFTGNETVICGAGSTEAYNPNTGALSGSCTHPYGTVDSLTFMVNGIVDLLPQYRLSPFVGAGIGVNYLSEVRVNGHAFGPGLPASAQGTFVDIDSSPAQEAYQLLGGFTYAVTDRVNVDLTYTFLSGGLEKVHDFVSGQSYKVRYIDHSVALGLRYSFAKAPAPPPPPPPPPPAPVYTARDYVIYFPWDQYVITPEAQNVLQDAAQYATAGHAKKELVVGHTDTSGTRAYNLRLSERRAKATADALVALGVPQDTLSVSWTGMDDLAVQTPPGVKEPLNRRSTIHIDF